MVTKPVIPDISLSNSASSARTNFAELVNRVTYGNERIILTKHGKPVAALVPIKDFSLLQESKDGDGQKQETKKRKD